LYGGSEPRIIINSNHILILFDIYIDLKYFLCYNTAMYKVNIPVNRAYAAIVWASTRFEQFDVQHMIPAQSYEFRFERSDEASYFALKWT
jgi:hypothetical protein